MEKLKKKYQTLLQAFSTVEDAIGSYKEFLDDEKFYEMSRDSLIQRFEYSIDMLWKYLRTHIQETLKIEIAPSPRTTFDEAEKQGLISEDERKILLKAITERNKTSHMYREEIADALAKQISDFFETMSRVAKRLG
ncbi:nucleotidyltransferase substrate binding protein [Candidatus Babeliales bacterium]|nr:nucleotidyltransferase substrate binding protein [Candidatus Babeliales bacterium]